MENIKTTIEQSEKYRPKLDFYIDADKEVDVALWFLRDEKMPYSPHDDLKHLLKEKDETKIRQEVEKFISDYYNAHREEIKASLRNVKKNWEQVEKSFYDKVDKLLNNYPWPKGEYRGMASVLNIYPRMIEEKWFTFPVKKQMPANGVIAHEMLHFIVYDYMEKKYGLEPSECYHENNQFWQFTENLNSLIEGEEMWKEFLDGDREVYVKESCKDLYKEMKEVWDKDRDVDGLIGETFKKELKGMENLTKTM